MSQKQTIRPRDLGRILEGLRGTHRALLTAACGIAADHQADDGAYHLLIAVAEKMERDVTQLEALVSQH